jgi:hypothetical protein
MRHAWFAFLCLLTGLGGIAKADVSMTRNVFVVTYVNEDIMKGIDAVLMPHDAKHDGVLSVYDNNLYVQCLNSHFLREWRCEAAGFEGQPWLHNVLTPERLATLAAAGFKPDKASGNFLAKVPKTTPPEELGAHLQNLLIDAYGVKKDDILVLAE